MASCAAKRRRVGGAALGEHLEEHAEGAPRPVDLALDHGQRQEAILRRRAGGHGRVELGDAPADHAVDRGQAPVRGTEMRGRRGEGQVLGPVADAGRGQPHQTARPALQPARLDREEAPHPQPAGPRPGRRRHLAWRQGCDERRHGTAPAPARLS